MRLNDNGQKSGTGTLFCCFTVLVTSDRNIIFPKMLNERMGYQLAVSFMIRSNDFDPLRDYFVHNKDKIQPNSFDVLMKTQYVETVWLNLVLIVYEIVSQRIKIIRSYNISYYTNGVLRAFKYMYLNFIYNIINFSKSLYEERFFFPLQTACIKLFIAVDTRTFLDRIIIKVALP